MSGFDQAFIKAYGQTSADDPVAESRRAAAQGWGPRRASAVYGDQTLTVESLYADERSSPTPAVGPWVAPSPAPLPPAPPSVPESPAAVSTIAPRPHFLAGPNPRHRRPPEAPAPPPMPASLPPTPSAATPVPAEPPAPVVVRRLDRAPEKEAAAPSPPASAPLPAWEAEGESLGRITGLVTEFTVHPPSAEPIGRPHAPLSAFLPAAPSPVAAVEEPPALVPQLRVERLIWPEVCRTLRDKLGDSLTGFASEIAAAAQAKPLLLLIAGERRGVGRTSLTLLLAQTLCELGHKVAIVDADVASPQLARRLGVMPPLGWDAVVSGAQPLDEALIESIADGATLCPLAAPLREPEPLLCGFRFDLMLRMLKEHYPVVLLDSSAAGDDGRGAGLALIESVPIDAAVLVRDGRQPLPANSALEQRLAAAGVELLGTIENWAT